MEIEFEHIRKEAITAAKLWAEFIKKKENEIWSKQQAEFINSIIETSRNNLLTKEIYLKAKKILEK